jgi:DNA-binding response OmpR family regulator
MDEAGRELAGSGLNTVQTLNQKMEEFMRPRVLIADTDDAWLDACERGLCESGFMVETARDGLSCLTRLQRNPRPDVIVLELDIPWGGGDGVLARLREETSELDCGVVIVTGRASPDVLSARTGIPSSACLRKPFHLDALLNLIGSPGCRVPTEDVHEPDGCAANSSILPAVNRIGGIPR